MVPLGYSKKKENIPFWVLIRINAHAVKKSGFTRAGEIAGADQHSLSHPRGHGVSLYRPSDGPLSSTDNWLAICSLGNCGGIPVV